MLFKSFSLIHYCVIVLNIGLYLAYAKVKKRFSLQNVNPGIPGSRDWFFSNPVIPGLTECSGITFPSWNVEDKASLAG